MKQEVWLRGPLPNTPPLLQPVAHALLQAREEVLDLMEGFEDDRLWVRPAAMASVGFHLQHLTGVLDRLFTYARGEMLSEGQLRSLKAEGVEEDSIRSADLVKQFCDQVEHALAQLRTFDEASLPHVRGVGRAQIPSTVIGLLVHAAEHTMRHVGQLLVTVQVLD